MEINDILDHEFRSRDDCHDRGDEYVEPPTVVESSQFKKEWEDIISLFLRQEFPSRATLQEVMDKGLFAKSFGYVIEKSDKERYVLTSFKKKLWLAYTSFNYSEYKYLLY